MQKYKNKRLTAEHRQLCYFPLYNPLIAAICETLLLLDEVISALLKKQLFYVSAKMDGLILNIFMKIGVCMLMF